MTGQQAPRAVVVVIHGVGEQPPMSTLGRFAQGMMDYAGASRPVAVLRRFGGSTVPILRFPGFAGHQETDVIEFAWQHLVRGRTTALSALVWLLSATLAPLDIGRHWRVLARAGRQTPSPWAVVIRQLLIAGGLVLPLLLFLTLTFLVVHRWLQGNLLPSMPADVDWTGTTLIVFALSLLLALISSFQLLAVVRDGFRAGRVKRRTRRVYGQDWAGLHGSQLRAWRFPAILIALVVLMAALGLACMSAGVYELLRAWLAKPEGRAWLMLCLALAAAGLLIPLFFSWVRDYAGDVSYYVMSDREAIARRSRRDISRNAAQLLNALLEDTAYKHVVVVGHSLGSVIAFDALNQLSRQVRLENALTAAQVGKMKGLLTFASPLDKVAYFFREHTADDAALHAQLLSFLHPTKRLSSRRDDGPYGMHRYSVPFTDLVWANLHSPQDLLSDPLVFYDVDQLCTVNYWGGGVHGRYWRDPRTYELLLGLLRPGPT